MGSEGCFFPDTERGFQLFAGSPAVDGELGPTFLILKFVIEAVLI